MSVFPPGGIEGLADGQDPKWTRWFAWFPVEIDVYDPSEIKNGQLRYKVCMRWVECRLTPDGDPPHDVARMQYRLPRNPQ
jgi:hypothetical protein